MRRLLWAFLFFIILLGKEEKIPGYLLCRVINIGSLSGKVGVRISQLSVLAKGEVGVPQSSPDL